jgi:hypothetical protein
MPLAQPDWHRKHSKSKDKKSITSVAPEEMREIIEYQTSYIAVWRDGERPSVHIIVGERLLYPTK